MGSVRGLRQRASELPAREGRSAAAAIRGFRGLGVGVIATSTVLALTAVSAQAAEVRTQPQPITFNIDPDPTTPYPSLIEVSGLAGQVADVNLSLYGLYHSTLTDLDVLLVAPDGRNAIVFSNVGCGLDSCSNPEAETFTLDDESPNSLSGVATPPTGTYRPINRSGPSDTDDFPAPAPTPTPGNVALSNFDGANPNGTWKLFTNDDRFDESGFLGGWSLDITTTSPANGFRLSDGFVNEGDTDRDMTFTVSRTGNTSQKASVQFNTDSGSTSNRAIKEVDFKSRSTLVQFAKNQTTATVKVRIIGDSLNEAPGETFKASLRNSSGPALVDGRADGLIYDDGGYFDTFPPPPAE